MILEETYTLSNDLLIPKLGLGTWFIKDDAAAQAVREAVDIGYRHIDTAQAYGNEAGVGEGVRTCGLKREDIFVTTKLDAGIKSYNEAVASIDASLKKMGLDYADLMIIHSPQPWTKFGDDDRYFDGNREAWRALEEAYKAGKLRSIGLSNFQQQDIDNIMDSASVKPMINQILAHISNMPQELIQYCKQSNILVEAYSPVGHGVLLKNSKIIELADKYRVSVPQLCIRYTLQHDLLPLPKTANPAHMKNNSELEFDISDADMRYLDEMDTIKDYGEASVFPVYSR